MAKYKKTEDIITDINVLEPEATYTYADYLKWSFQERVEIIKGKLFKMSPAPGREHQEISGNFFYEFKLFLKEKPCKVYAAPFDVRLPLEEALKDEETFTVVQPDLCIVCDLSKLDKRGCNGAPDLVVEILSENSSKKDLKNKYSIYEEHGVMEYWVVYPGEKVVEIFVLSSSGIYELLDKYTKEDTVVSKTFPKMEIDLCTIFEQ